MQLSYKDAVDYLVKHPCELERAWIHPSHHIAGRLFNFCFRGRSLPLACGCPSMIREGDSYAFNEDRTINEVVTNAIRSDDQLLTYEQLRSLRGDALRVALERYAEWQGVLDVELTHDATASTVVS